MNQEVIIDAFINNVEKLYYKHPDAGEDGFGSEFQTIKKQSFALKKNQNFQSSVGELVENKKKSRYKDILPFDHSRVKLPLWDGTTSDYINASFIEGPDRNRSYIASQGPLPHTVDDFWRMLWGCNVKVIIMVCREVELGKRKCEMYWEPTENKKSFGDISITLDSTDNSEKAFCKRTIIAKRGNETRTFYQLHYMTWPDHDVPRTRDDILQMISTARKLQDYSSDVNTPLCVHCSAGCGRTGAVLVIDYFRDLLLHKKLTSNIRVLDVVLSMRQQRPAIVQTKEQYEFVNLAVSEMFAKHMIESGKSLSSNLSKSLMSTDYENVVIKQKESPKPAIRRSEVQATTPARNNYENVQLDFGNPSIASKKNWLPEPTSPSKSKENKPVTPKRPFSSNSVPHDHHSNFQSNTTAKPKTPETSPPSSGLIGRMQASLQGDSLHSQSNMKLKTNADPKSPSPPHQAVKPRLRSTAPDSKRSNASAESDLSKTNTNTSLKPLLPLKLKQTFKQKSNPPLQKNLKEEAITLSSNGGQSYDVTYSMSDEVDIATEELYAFPSDDVQSGILHSNTAAYYSTLTNENHLVEQHDSIYCLEESRDSSQIYEQVDHNNGARRKASGGLSKLNVATPNSNKVEMKRHSSHTPPVSEMPPLPERTTESYEVLENPDLSSYEDLGTTTKPVENTRRISGTTSALAGVGAKAKNLLGRKHHSRTKSEKKSSLNGTSRTFFAGANVKEESTKTVHTSSVPESNIAPKNQFQFPRRGAKKPKGPKPKPSTWPKFSEK